MEPVSVVPLRDGDAGWLLTRPHSALIENCSRDGVTQMPLVCVELSTVTSGATGEGTLCRAEMVLAAAAQPTLQVAHCPAPRGPLGHSGNVLQTLKKRWRHILSHWKPVQMGLLKQTLYFEVFGKGPQMNLNKGYFLNDSLRREDDHF